MAITKLDLYNPEWLELVFDNKNKDYGAYDLRKHYAGNLLKSMAIAFFSVAVLYTGYIILKPKPQPFTRVIPDVYIIPSVNVEHPRTIIPPRTEASKPQSQTPTIKYLVMKPEADQNAENPPTLIELNGKAIGSETKKGNGEGVNIDIPEGPGVVAPEVIEEKPKEMYEIQVLPQPFGGEAAWAKFLQKNLRYPPAAVDAHIQGRVFLSFIIEKDGHISNIVVEKGVGFGLDEEAVRVLKLAPAWKPGIQNGHQVRVKFNMPISFQLSDPD